MGAKSGAEVRHKNTYNLEIVIWSCDGGYFGAKKKRPELPVPRLCTLHRSWIAPCSTLGSRRYTRIAPWSTLSALCWPRISPCPTLNSMCVCGYLRTRHLVLAPFADCSALD